MRTRSTRITDFFPASKKQTPRTYKRARDPASKVVHPAKRGCHTDVQEMVRRTCVGGTPRDPSPSTRQDAGGLTGCASPAEGDSPWYEHLDTTSEFGYQGVRMENGVLSLPGGMGADQSLELKALMRCGILVGQILYQLGGTPMALSSRVISQAVVPDLLVANLCGTFDADQLVAVLPSIRAATSVSLVSFQTTSTASLSAIIDSKFSPQCTDLRIRASGWHRRRFTNPHAGDLHDYAIEVSIDSLIQRGLRHLYIDDSVVCFSLLARLHEKHASVPSPVKLERVAIDNIPTTVWPEFFAWIRRMPLCRRVIVKSCLDTRVRACEFFRAIGSTKTPHVTTIDLIMATTQEVDAFLFAVPTMAVAFVCANAMRELRIVLPLHVVDAGTTDAGIAAMHRCARVVDLLRHTLHSSPHIVALTIENLSLTRKTCSFLFALFAESNHLTHVNLPNLAFVDAEQKGSHDAHHFDSHPWWKRMHEICRDIFCSGINFDQVSIQPNLAVCRESSSRFAAVLADAFRFFNPDPICIILS